MDAVCAIGGLGDGDVWVGFRRTDADAFELVLGTSAGGARPLTAEPELLLAAAIAHFEEALPEAPHDLEATQADLAALVRYLASLETEPARRRLLAEAVDAIDDGLAGDAVAARLVALWNGPRDPVEALVERARGEPDTARPARDG